MQFIPLVKYFGTIEIYKTLGTKYIEGSSNYQSFVEMNQDMRNACLKTVKELHSHRVTHGDLEAWNFIIQESSNQKGTDL